MLLKSKKKLKINNKISKKNNIKYNKFTIIGGNKPLIFVQHNIGHIEYNIKKNLYYNSYLIKHKKHSSYPLRDFVYYYYLNKCINKSADIFFLQEVQYGDNSFMNSDYQYYINYTVTGHIDYCDETETEESIQRISHGCILGINQNRFNIIDGLKKSTVNIRNSKNKKYRTSDFLIIKDKTTKKLYCVLTLHGPICDMSNNDKLSSYYKFYKDIIQGIEKIIKKYKNKINFIITGDFNINLFNPNFNPFNNKIQNEESIKNILKNIIKEFITILNKNNIEIVNYNEQTAFGKDFKERLDFILLSNKLLKNYNMETRKYYKKNKSTTNYNIGDLDFLFNDFDHTKLIGYLN